jgi:hypothetical protein
MARLCDTTGWAFNSITWDNNFSGFFELILLGSKVILNEKKSMFNPVPALIVFQVDGPVLRTFFLLPVFYISPEQSGA